MLYLFEGPDCSGKTTAAEQLSKELRIPVIPKTVDFSKENRQSWDEPFILMGTDIILGVTQERYDADIFSFALSGFSFIIDRAFVTGIVYNAVCNRGYDTSYALKFLRVLRERGFLTLFQMKVPLSLILERWKADEDKWTEDELLLIYNEYERFWAGYAKELGATVLKGY